MPKPGDRVIVEGTKVGGGRREGTLVGTVGSLIKVRWADGTETVMAPAAGAVRILPGSSGSSGSNRSGSDGSGARATRKATASRTPARARKASKAQAKRSTRGRRR
jgi:hypothetical protein